QDGLGIPPHSSTHPTAIEISIATTNVAGANRVANRGPNDPICIANSLRSTIGPTTRKARRAVRENCVSEAATNASASEQIDRITASSASAITEKTGFAAISSNHRGGTVTLSTAAANAPTTRKPP